MAATTTIPDARVPSSGGVLVATDGRTLPLVGVTLRGDARGGFARVVLVQEFRNAYDERLALHYAFALPHEAAVGSYAFTLGDRRYTGRVEKREDARRRYEDAILSGHTAGLIKEHRSTVFGHELGNVPPGATIRVELEIDQPLRWLPEGRWEWRFPTVVAPRYLGAPGRVADASQVAQAVADRPLGIPVALALTVHDTLSPGGELESSSHAITVAPNDGVLDVAFRLGRNGVSPRPDRDVVVTWPVARPAPGATLAVARPADGGIARSAYGLLTLVPPAPESVAPAHPRNLLVLLDTSGSMRGEPLLLAQAVLDSVLQRLGPDDSLELLAFAGEVERWRSGRTPCTPEALVDARAWLHGLEAGGGTEMSHALQAVLTRIGAQRQVLLVTDGFVGFECEIVAYIWRRLPLGTRLHVVGVGPAPNRTLTAGASRAGRGQEVLVGLDDPVSEAAARVAAAIDAPLLTDLELGGDALRMRAPAALRDLLAGSPTRVALSLVPEGGTLLVRGRTANGSWERQLVVPPCAPGTGDPMLPRLFARERVQDLELELAAAHQGLTVEGAEPDEEIERLGLAFQIATRKTSWCAVSDSATTNPDEPLREERIPQALPARLARDGLGLQALLARDEELQGLRDARPVIGSREGVPPGPRNDILQARLRQIEARALRKLYRGKALPPFLQERKPAKPRQGSSAPKVLVKRRHDGVLVLILPNRLRREVATASRILVQTRKAPYEAQRRGRKQPSGPPVYELELPAGATEDELEEPIEIFLLGPDRTSRHVVHPRRWGPKP